MVRYHLAPRRLGRLGRQADAAAARPARLRVASPASTQRALPGAAAVELGHNFASSTTTSRTATSSAATGRRCGRVHGVPQAINTGDTLFSLSRIALHRLTDLGFPDRKVLRLMRLYDETCLALCEGQYIDIAMSASDEPDERRAATST